MNKKRMGHLLIIISLFFLAIGIGEYLHGSRLFIGSVRGDDYAEVWRIKENDSYYIWYNVTLKKVELNFSISFSFEVESEQPIDFYVMSSLQFSAWKNTSIPQSLVAKTNVSIDWVNFYPANDDTYYFVLDNRAHNTTRNISVKSSWIATVYLIDYSEAVTWLFLALAGSFVFFTGSILSGNPINRLYRRINEAIRIRSIMKEEDPSIFATVTKSLLIMLWVIIIVPPLLLLAILLSKIPSLWEIPPEFSPIVLDLMLRIFLFYFFSLILPMALCFVLGGLLFSIASDVDKWFIQRKGVAQPNPMFQSLVWKYSGKYLLSRWSICCYLVAVLPFIAGYSLQGAGFLLYMVGAAILAIPFGQSLFVSSKEACRTLNLKWKRELRIDRIYTFNSTVLMLWVLVGVLVILKILIPSGIFFGDSFFFDSSPYPVMTDILSFVPTTSETNALIETVFSTISLGAVVFLAVFISIEYHLLPIFASREKKRRKLELLIFPIIIAVISTATGNILVYAISPQSLSNPFIAFMLPLSSFVAGYFAEKAFEELKSEALG